MSEWPETALGDLAEVVMGQSPAGSDCNRVGEGWPLLNGPTEFGMRHPLPAQWTKAPTKWAEPGDVLFCVRGSTTGRMNIADQKYVIGRGIAAIRSKNAGLTPFVRYAVEWRLAALLSLTTGSTFPNLSRESIAGLHLPNPPVDEQRRIVEVLGALDDLIDTNNRLIEKSKSLSTTLFSSMLEKRVQCRLGDIADVNPTKVKPKSSGELIYLDIASLGNGSISWPDPISWAEAPGRARRGASVGSTLWSNVRPNRLGHALLLHAPDNLVVSTGISVLEPRDVGPAELHEITQTEAFVAHLVARSDGSAYPAVTASVFEDAPVERLSAADSERFEAIAWPLWESVAQLENENEQLRHTCDELLPSLMSGAVRVRPEGVAA